MTRIVRFLTPSDIFDICCPSTTSRSTVDFIGGNESSSDLDLLHSHGTGSSFALIPPQASAIETEKKFAEMKQGESTKAIMDQLTKVHEDLRKVSTLSTKDKSQINSMLLLVRGEVINKKSSDGISKKIKKNLSKKFRPGKKQRAADV
jgi:hypothetical protein